jgi:hypothetical protein
MASVGNGRAASEPSRDPKFGALLGVPNNNNNPHRSHSGSRNYSAQPAVPDSLESIRRPVPGGGGQLASNQRVSRRQENHYPGQVRLTPCLQTGLVFPWLWRPSTIVVAVLGSRMLLVLLNRAVSPRPSVSWHLQPTVLARWLLRLANLVLSRRPPTHTRMFARRASTRSVVRRWAWRDTRARLGLAFLVFYS